MRALAPLRSHLRWTIAAWRSAHPLLLASFAVCAWGLYRYMLDSQAGWDWFSFEDALNRETLGLAFLAGFLFCVIQDGTGRDDPSLRYQATRPLSRLAISRRSVFFPLVAGALVFLVWTPARDYCENLRIWWPERHGLAVYTSMARDGLAMSRDKMVTLSESRRRASIWGSHVEMFQAAGMSPRSGSYEYWYRNPDEKAKADWRFKQSRGTREQKERALNYRRQFEEYRLWRDGKGPLTDSVRKSWWFVILPFNMHWYMWGSWYLAFTAGVCLRAWMIFGREDGAMGGIRRVVTLRNLVPLALLAYVVRVDQWLPYPSQVYGWSLVRQAILGAYLHGPLYLALGVAVLVVPSLLLARGWNRRDIM